MPAFPKPTATETDPVAGPNLTNHTALTTTAHGGIVASSDARLTDSRTPTAHKSTHATGGSDALAPSDIGAATSAAVTTAQSTADSAVALVASEASRAQTAEALLAPKASPAFTGNPTVPNQSAGDNSTKAANTAYVKTAVDAVDTSTLIPKSIGTAKGDTIAFTGSGVPARKAAGGNGKVLSADSSQSDGLLYAAREVVLPYKTGRFYGCPSATFTTTNWALGFGSFTPFFCNSEQAWDRISLYVNSTQASSSHRLGIYNDNGGVPGTLLLDAGNVATASTGAKSITISQTLGGKVYWLAQVPQTTAAFVIALADSHSLTGVGDDAANLGTSSACNGYYAAISAGSLPADAGNLTLVIHPNPAMLWLRAA